MSPDRCGSGHLDAEFGRHVKRLGIQIIHNLDVIRNESKRRDKNIVHSFATQCPQMVENVGSEPRLSRRPTATLKDQIPPAES
jgi:hypothetical protein